MMTCNKREYIFLCVVIIIIFRIVINYYYYYLKNTKITS
jgi:hypothetical protein